MESKQDIKINLIQLKESSQRSLDRIEDSEMSDSSSDKLDSLNS